MPAIVGTSEGRESDPPGRIEGSVSRIIWALRGVGGGAVDCMVGTDEGCA